MKLRRLLLVLLVLIAGLPVVAQENTLWKDGFTAGVGYGFNVRDIKTLDYKGVALSGGYRKFLYSGLFVMPEVSLYWQEYEYEGAPPGGSLATHSLNRFGIGADALLGVRIAVSGKVGIDLMAGPYIGWSFANNRSDYFYGDYDNFEVRGRFGIGMTVLNKIYVNVFYDAAKTKFTDNGRNRGNIMSVGIGYSF